MHFTHLAFMLHLPPILYSIIRSSYHVFHGASVPSGPGRPRYRCFTITLGHTTLGNSLLDEWSDRPRDIYVTTHNTRKRHTHIRAPRGIRTRKGAAADARRKQRVQAVKYPIMWWREQITGFPIVQYLTIPISSFPLACWYFPRQHDLESPQAWFAVQVQSRSTETLFTVFQQQCPQ